MKRTACGWIALGLMVGVPVGALLKAGNSVPSQMTAGDRLVEWQRAAAVDTARADFVERPQDWEAGYRYLLTLAQLSETRAGGADHLSTREQQRLLERLAGTRHNPEQKARLLILERRVLTPTYQVPE